MKKRSKKRSRAAQRPRTAGKSRSSPPASGPAAGAKKTTLFEMAPLELECMKALWHLESEGRDGEATVNDIRAVLARFHRRLAYTTVETIMDRLNRKGMVSRRRKGRAHRYTVEFPLHRAQAEGVRILLNHFFGGSRRALRAFLEGGAASALVERPAEFSARPTGTHLGRRESALAPAKRSSLDTSLL